MNAKRTLRIVRQIIHEYDEGKLMGSMRQFVTTLRSLLVTSGPECEELIKQSLRVLFSDLDRSPLNLIPERHLEFLRGLNDRDLVGSGLKRTVMDMISEGSYTRGWVLQQFSDLLAQMTELGDQLKNIERNLSMLQISVEDIPESKAIINASVVPDSVTSSDFSESTSAVVGLMREVCRLGGGGNFSVEMQVEDRADSLLSFTVERPVAVLFCVIYLGILDTYAYIGNFDTQIANLKSLKTSKGVLNVLEKEKKRMLNERLVVATNVALTEFFKDGKYSQETFDQTYSVLLELVSKIEEGFDFDVELGPQTDLPGQMQTSSDRLIHYLYAINKLLPAPRKGLRRLIDDIRSKRGQGRHDLSTPHDPHAPRQSAQDQPASLTADEPPAPRLDVCYSEPSLLH